MKTIVKKSGKNSRERKVLLGLVEHYLKTGKPVGSNTLKEEGFADLSSATIRNYFAHLEEEGYLTQQHSSGGRIPTNRAFRLYAQEHHDSHEVPPDQQKEINQLRQNDTKEIAAFLQQAAELLTRLTHTAVFISAPRFDQDFIVGIKLVAIDANRCLCILITDFGMIQTEVMVTSTKLSAFSVKHMESYFQWRLTGLNPPQNLSPKEEEQAKEFYNELMMRYVVGYTSFIDEEIYRTGFSKLLSYPEFYDPTMLASSLSLFENTHGMRLLLRECEKMNTLRFWVGDDLVSYSNTSNPECSVCTIPYQVNKQTVGAIGLLGPTRIPYKQLFGVLRAFAQGVGDVLTRNVYKFKITIRQPQRERMDGKWKDTLLLEGSRRLLIEDKRS